MTGFTRLIFRIRFLVVAFVLLTVVPAIGQTLPHKSHTTSDGLGNDYVNRIMRDSRGFIWF